MNDATRVVQLRKVASNLVADDAGGEEQLVLTFHWGHHSGSETPPLGRK